MNLITVPRLIPKGSNNPRYNLPYSNMEQKIQEYITHHRANETCYIFKPRNSSNESHADFMTNRVEDIVGRIVSVRDTDVIIEILNKEFFKKFENKIYVSIASLSNIKDNKEIYIDKIVRFEAHIKG